MESADLNRIMQDDEIVPSAGFAASVMEAVQREAATPPPISFPWRRALPGLVAIFVVTGLLVAEIVNFVRHANAATPIDESGLQSVLPAGSGGAALWVAVGLLTAAVSILLSFRLVRQV